MFSLALSINPPQDTSSMLIKDLSPKTPNSQNSAKQDHCHIYFPSPQIMKYPRYLNQKCVLTSNIYPQLYRQFKFIIRAVILTRRMQAKIETRSGLVTVCFASSIGIQITFVVFVDLRVCSDLYSTYLGNRVCGRIESMFYFFSLVVLG